MPGDVKLQHFHCQLSLVPQQIDTKQLRCAIFPSNLYNNIVAFPKSSRMPSITTDAPQSASCAVYKTYHLLIGYSYNCNQSTNDKFCSLA